MGTINGPRNVFVLDPDLNHEVATDIQMCVLTASVKSSREAGRADQDSRLASRHFTEVMSQLGWRIGNQTFESIRFEQHRSVFLPQTITLPTKGPLYPALLCMQITSASSVRLLQAGTSPDQDLSVVTVHQSRDQSGTSVSSREYDVETWSGTLNRSVFQSVRTSLIDKLVDSFRQELVAHSPDTAQNASRSKQDA